MRKIKLIALAFAALVCGSTWAKDPSASLDVETAAGENDYYQLEAIPDIKNLDYVGYNSTGSGSGSILSGSRWKLSSSRTITFKVKNCGKFEMQNEFTKDATTKVFYSINGSTATEFNSNGSDKKCVKVNSFETETDEEITIVISADQDVLLGYVNFYKYVPKAPMVKSYKIAGIDATIDQENKTITAELPFGTKKVEAIQNATVTIDGTAKGYAYNVDYSILSVSDSAEVDPVVVNYTLAISVKETASTDATLKAITVDEVALSGFAADKYDYQMVASGLPVVAAEANDVAAKVDIEQAAANPGTATITVTAQDGETKLVYTIAFTSADKICGTLINALTTSASAATVTGNLTGTADVKLKDVAEYEGYTGYKMNSNDYYFGITLTQGAFRQGDVLNFFVTKVDAGKKAELFTDKGTTSIYVAENQTELGVNSIVLPAAAEGATSLYLYRNATNSYNPTIAYMEVVRDCNPKLMDFTIAGITATIDQELLTVTANLPYGTVLTDNDWNNAYTLNGAATGAEYGAEHATLAVKGGEEDLVYTLNINISQELSSNNNLSKITVNGNEVANFSAAVTEYAYTLPYGTTEMPVIAAETEDITATAVIDQVDSLTQNVKITVTAQNEAQKVYSVQLAVAAAPKELTSVQFSNGAYGAINDGIVQVPYMGTMPTMTDYVAENATAIAQDDKIIVTSTLDQTTREYALQGVELTAGASCNVGITFDGTESYVFAHYGWDADKGYKFAKAVDEASNMRIAKGNTRLYMALPAAYTVTLTSGTGGKRNINVYVNGVKDETVTATAASGATITINLDPTADNFLMIESNQTGGDGGFTAMTVTNTPTALKDAIMSSKAVKFMHRGIMYIRHENKFYNVLGNPVKF